MLEGERKTVFQGTVSWLIGGLSRRKDDWRGAPLQGLGSSGSPLSRQLLRDCARGKAPGRVRIPAGPSFVQLLAGVRKTMAGKGEVCISGRTKL